MTRLATAGTSLQPTLPWTYADDIETIDVLGNGMLPLYRHGDRLIVCREAPMKIGDRVVIKSPFVGTVGGMLLHRDDTHVVVCVGGKTKASVTVSKADIDFIGRVIWASQ